MMGRKMSESSDEDVGNMFQTQTQKQKQNQSSKKNVSINNQKKSTNNVDDKDVDECDEDTCIIC